MHVKPRLEDMSVENDLFSNGHSPVVPLATVISFSVSMQLHMTESHCQQATRSSAVWPAKVIESNTLGRPNLLAKHASCLAQYWVLMS